MLRDCLVALLLKSSSFLEGGHARHVKVSESLSAKDCDRVVLVFGRVQLDTGVLLGGIDFCQRLCGRYEN